MKARAIGAFVGVAVFVFGFSAQAQAARVLVNSNVVRGEAAPGSIEGACGLAISAGRIYVSDYYHHAVDVFNLPFDSSPGAYLSRIPQNPLNGPCQLATSSTGVLYANDWHEGVSQILPSELSFDSAESTGVAVDQGDGNVYVNDRTYIAIYEPSGAPLLDGEGDPLRIGFDRVGGTSTLGDAYGIAVSEGRVYVPDASDGTVKVYEPSVDTVDPVLTIDGLGTPQHGFHSLVDAAVAVDPTNGHLLVVDNLQPGFEHPEAVVDEFDSSGVFLGQLPRKVIDGGPSGLGFSGPDLYVTSGNSAGSSVLEFGPYSAGGGGTMGKSEAPAPAAPVPASVSASSPPAGRKTDPLGPALFDQATIVQKGGIKVVFKGRLTPQRLPRDRSAPVRVAVGAKIDPIDDASPPQLRTISIAINRYGHFNPTGLPLCAERDIQPATTQNALRACRSALVGVGSFSANVAVSRQSPFPAEGKMYAFNSEINGKPAILAHVYGTKPIPTSLTFPFILTSSKGTYGTTLTAKLPQANGSSYVTGLSMNLGRSFNSHGKRRSYLSASCPAPQGFHKAVFPLARARFSFKGGRELASTLVRSCMARG